MSPFPSADPRRSEVAVVVGETLREVGPEIRELLSSDPSNERQRQQRELDLSRELESTISAELTSMTPDRVVSIAEELAKDPNTSAATRQNLETNLQTLGADIQFLRGVVGTYLTGEDKSGLGPDNPLTPAEREIARGNLEELLSKMSEEQLRQLQDKLGLEKLDPNASKDEIIQSLLDADLITRLEKDPAAAIELARVLAESGELNEESSAALKEIVERSEQTLEEIRELVGKEMLERILKLIDELALLEQDPSAPPPTEEKRSSVDLPPQADFLLALKRSGGIEKIFLPFDEKKDDELARALAEQDKRLRERAEKEEKQESAEREERSDLARTIDRIARENPQLFNSLLGLRAEQMSFQDAFTVAAKTPPYQGPFA